MDTYQKLRDRINELVPELKGIRFGLPVKYKGVEGIFCTVGNKLDRWNIHLKGNSSAKQVDTRDEDFEILGRPIQLADVLRAIGGKHPYHLKWHATAAYFVFNAGTEKRDFKMEWNLSASLSGQSPEVWQFLLDILK